MILIADLLFSFVGIIAKMINNSFGDCSSFNRVVRIRCLVVVG
jgi:hypothetical protein